MKIDRELLKGTAATLVLAVLADGPAHGYALAQRIRGRTGGLWSLGEGTLYPLLYNLEDRGWIRGVWETGVGKRRRRVYSVTPKGHQQLADRKAQWQTLVTGMTLALGGA